MLICNPYEVIIEGTTNKGKRFRPSDWSERLSGILSSFNTGRLSYHQYVRPMLLDNVRCVAVDKKLESINPQMFQFLMDFAHDNDLRIIDCKALMKEHGDTTNLVDAVNAKDAADKKAAQEGVLASAEKAATAVVIEEPIVIEQVVVEPISHPKPVVVELKAGETARAFNAISVIRPHLDSAKMLAAQVDNILRPDGYRIIAIFANETDEQAAAACGFRLAHNLAWGRHLWVEDLSRLESHSGHGYGQALFAWVKDEAKRLGCSQIHMNVTVDKRGNSTQKLCLNAGFYLSHHHYSFVFE